MDKKGVAHILSHGIAFGLTISFLVYLLSFRDNFHIQQLFEKCIRFLHIYCFATLVGVQFWMHISGFTLYKNLTRTVFAETQVKIFPMYFMTGIITCTLSLLSHVYINFGVVLYEADSLLVYQTLGLIVCLLGFLLNFFFLGPETIRLVLLRSQRIQFLGVKDDIGPIDPKLVKHDEIYVSITRKFLRMHITCSLINIICYAACNVCIWCMVTK